MATSSGVRASAVITSNATIASGRIGAKASLLDAYGTTVSRGTMEYNTTSSSVQAFTDVYTIYGNYRGYGETVVWNEKTGQYFTTACKVTSNLPYFPNGYALKHIFTNPTVEALISVEDGVERGTLDQVGPFGTHPRLIRARGVDGTIGYVLYTEFMDIATNPEEAVLRMLEKDYTPASIPLYATDGVTVIGAFI